MSLHKNEWALNGNFAIAQSSQIQNVVAQNRSHSVKWESTNKNKHIVIIFYVETSTHQSQARGWSYVHI